MHIIALIVGLAVGGALWSAGHPVWGVIGGLFIASGLWLNLPWGLLSPQRTRDAKQFQAAAHAAGLWDQWSADTVAVMFDRWRRARASDGMSATAFMEVVVENRRGRFSEPSTPPGEGDSGPQTEA